MSSPETPSAKPRRASGCLVRIAWMIAGNAALAILAVHISGRRDLSWRAVDTAFWAIAAALVLLRWVDVRYLAGETATGDPATPAHWRRYAWLLPLVALLAWGAAHGVAWLR